MCLEDPSMLGEGVHDGESPPEPAPKPPPQSYLSQGNAASTTPGPAPAFHLMEIPTLSL